MYPKTGELPNGGLVMSMRRAILAAATAAVAAGPALTGCGPASPSSGGTAPPADGIGPITIAVGSDDAPVFSRLIKPRNKAHPDQVTLALLFSAVYEAPTFTKSPRQALTELSAQLTQIIRDG
jgi:hypothetical protein